jgi:hypothetical protein
MNSLQLLLSIALLRPSQLLLGARMMFFRARDCSTDRRAVTTSTTAASGTATKRTTLPRPGPNWITSYGRDATPKKTGGTRLSTQRTAEPRSMNKGLNLTAHTGRPSNYTALRSKRAA